jgi:DNA-binding NarL/FixJ family response regulator
LLNNVIPATETYELSNDEFRMTRKRVLVVDDLAPVLTAVSTLLRDSFDVVCMVSDGQSALDAALAHEPDLIVLDISMPGMTGIEVASELKNRGSRAKIVFLTIHEDSDIIASCLAAGGVGYVLKAQMDSDLVLAMNEALAGRVFLSRLTS